MTSYQSTGKEVKPILIALTCIYVQTKCIQINITKIISKYRNPILFGENIRTGCSYQLTRDELTQKCQFYRQRMLQLLLGKLIYHSSLTLFGKTLQFSTNIAFDLKCFFHDTLYLYTNS